MIPGRLFRPVFVIFTACAAYAARAVRAANSDPWISAALVIGLAALFLPPQPSPPPFWRIAVLALAEEILFRAGLQAWLEKRLSRRWGPFTLANAATGVFFCLAHLPMHPPLHAVAVFFPSLVFGVLWTRHRSIFLCAVMHCYYNVLYYM